MRASQFPPEFNLLKRLAKGLDAFVSGEKPIRVAILGDSATQFLSQAIHNSGVLEGMNLQLFESDFGQIDQQAFDEESDLYAFQPNYVIIVWTAHKCRNAFYNLTPDDQTSWHERFLQQVAQVIAAIQKGCGAKILLSNLEEQPDGVFGNFATKANKSFLGQSRRVNVALADLASENPGIYPLDVAAMQAWFGREAHNPSIYASTELVHSLDFTALIARQAVQVISALEGRFHKCLILDLDNTLWGGIIGDDGVDRIELGGTGVGKAYQEFQRWILQLQRRGIILAICSKNDFDVAQTPFLHHPDMVLRLEHIAVFVANWENKADNIRHIQDVLNIGFDSMVFLDDNPVERQLIREQLPEVAVPDLPEDPACYLSYLTPLGLFETASVSENDGERTRQYQQEAARLVQSKAYTNLDDFLRSLEMSSFTRAFRSFDIPRVAQLSQRSNQFNLRTVRYSDADVQRIAESSEYHTLAFDLEDKFGNHGLIAVVILHDRNPQSLFFDTWFMSCRVLKRGMENFVLNEVVELARKLGKTHLTGAYIPTAKNTMVQNHYRDLGFRAIGGEWTLALAEYNQPQLFIKKTELEK